MSGETYENLRLELRRGSLTLAVLMALRSEHYGYTLRKWLSEQGMEIEESTLYPLMRRLESQGLLVSQWREENKRNKRFYRLSPDGERILARLLAEWQSITNSLVRVSGQQSASVEGTPPRNGSSITSPSMTPLPQEKDAAPNASAAPSSDSQDPG